MKESYKPSPQNIIHYYGFNRAERVIKSSTKMALNFMKHFPLKTQWKRKKQMIVPSRIV